MAVKRMWITPEGEIKEKLTDEEMTAFQQKVIDLLTPLAYEQVVKDLEKQKDKVP